MELGELVSQAEAPQREKGFSMIPQQHEALIATAKIKRLICLSRNGEAPAIDSLELSRDQFHISSPPRRTEYSKHWGTSIATYTSDDSSSPCTVLIEWRLASAARRGSKITVADLTQRRNEVVALLREISSLPHETSPACRILNCLGWSALTAKYSDLSYNLVGFAYKLPPWADESRPPVTLRTLLARAKEDCGHSNTPSLRARFNLARALAQAAHQLQCSQWLHRALGSHQVLLLLRRREYTTSARRALSGRPKAFPDR